MDRSLWLLNFLRARAWLRRWTRSFRSLKGLLLGLVGSLIFLPMLFSIVIVPDVRPHAQLASIRLYGPMTLLAYCVLNVLLSSGDRAIYYSPAEVNFLFSGPYRTRQLLLYKILTGALVSLLTAFFMLFLFAHHSPRYLSAYVGIFLALELLTLFALAVGLLLNVVGALAFSLGRKAILVGVGALAVAAVWPLGREALALPPLVLLDRALASPAVAVVTLPFRPFIMAFTAERVWPDLVGSALAALAVDLALVGLVLALNAQFLEAASGASARVYAKIRRVKRGDVWTVSGKARFAVPTLPWWGGIGPNLWRQLTTAARSPTRLLGMMALFVFPVVFTLFSARNESGGKDLLGPAMGAIFMITFVATSTVGYDFRPDLRGMEDLKTLPIRPIALALGQLLTPVIVLSLGQWLAIGLIAAISTPDPNLMAAVLVLGPSCNLVLMAIENMYFLWYPYRTNAMTSYDFQAMGRQVLLMLAKLFCLAIIGGLAAGAGWLAYWAGGDLWPAAIAAAWLVVTACGIGLVPLVGLAFERFDVAGDTPE